SAEMLPVKVKPPSPEKTVELVSWRLPPMVKESAAVGAEKVTEPSTPGDGKPAVVARAAWSTRLPLSLRAAAAERFALLVKVSVTPGSTQRVPPVAMVKAPVTTVFDLTTRL